MSGAAGLISEGSEGTVPEARLFFLMMTLTELRRELPCEKDNCRAFDSSDFIVCIFTKLIDVSLAELFLLDSKICES